MTQRPKLLFIHRGEAMYPMNKSLKAHLEGRIDCFDETYESAAARPDIGECICWHLMGMYRQNLPCKFTIHDYRSLSIGRGRRIKDLLKRHLNARPDARVSKNEIEAVMKFRDGVETIIVDISVSDYVLEYRSKPVIEPEYDFAYVGVMSRERGMEKVLRQYADIMPSERKMLLIGAAQDGLDEEFAGVPNLIFAGRVEQREVFRQLQNCGVALGFFPNHFPHTHQTPTKLLEYGALGLRILCNEQPMNRARAADYNLKAVWRPDDALFHDLPPLTEWHDNYDTDPEPLLFSTHYRDSGLEELINRITDSASCSQRPSSQVSWS